MVFPVPLAWIPLLPLPFPYFPEQGANLIFLTMKQDYSLTCLWLLGILSIKQWFSTLAWVTATCRACEKTNCWVPLGVSGSMGLGWGLTVCISNKFHMMLRLLLLRLILAKRLRSDKVAAPESTPWEPIHGDRDTTDVQETIPSSSSTLPFPEVKLSLSYENTFEYILYNQSYSKKYPSPTHTKLDDGQTIYKNRILTHNLQQPAQEANPLSTVTSTGSQSTISHNQFRKPINNFQNNQPQMTRIN